MSDLQPAGKRFTLLAPDAESLTAGSPILHKKLKIGEVENFRFSSDQKAVLIECIVFDEFKNIIQQNSRFFNTSGLQISGGLEGIKLQTGSLQSVLTGGIGCINPSPGAPSIAPSPYSLYANLQEALHADETEMTVLLDEAHNLKEGSPVRNNGIEIGRVNKLHLGDKQTIVATLRINENATTLFRNGTKIWVEQAQFNLSGIKNAETMVFGSFFNILPGNGNLTRTFKSEAEPPLTEIASRRGLGIILETGHLGSLDIGSPVYYRQLQIGEVTGYDLSPSFQKVRVFITIRPQFSAIIRANTRFWQVSGARIEGGIFSGLTVSAESLTAIIRGGIALATPDGERTGSAIAAGHLFPLHDVPEKQWLDWSPDVILFEQDGANFLPVKSQ